jgi:hypothetical protein
MTKPLHIPYQHPVVRDLAWVMISPGLLQTAPPGQALVTDDWCRQVYAANEHHLRELDENPAPLLKILSDNKSHRLGVYFEYLLRYWLKNILQVQQLQHNLPVFERHQKNGKRTLGEFDLLFRPVANQPLQHWEATVKFYLLKTDDAGKAYWLGPGGRDRLDIKLDRLFQHQLKLAGLPQAQEYLKGEGCDSVQSAAFIKGYLFYPLNENKNRVHNSFSAERHNPVPYELSRCHQQGWWLHWKETPMPRTTIDSRWLVLAKSRWLSPARYVGEDGGLMTQDALDDFIADHFRQQQSRPVLVAEMTREKDVWQEVSRGFVLAPE